MSSNEFPVLSAESILRQVLHASDCLSTPDTFCVLEPGRIVSPTTLGLDFRGNGYQLFNAFSTKFPTIKQDTKFEITKTILMHITDAIVFPNTGQVIKDGVAFREKYAPSGYFEKCMEELRGIFGYDRNENTINFSDQFSFAKKYEKYQIENATVIDEPYYLLTNEINDQRFFHWMNLRLTEARMFANVTREKVGFASSYDLLPWQIDSLNLYFKNKISKILHFKEPVKFKNLFMVCYSNKNYLKVDYEHYGWIKSKFDDIPSEELPTKIYLSRSDVNRRHYLNESDVVSTLEKYGIKKVELSKMPMKKQFLMLSKAEVVIMPAGSATVFLPFLKKDCKLMYIDWNDSDFFDKHFELYTILHKLKNAIMLKNALIRTHAVDDDGLLELDISVLRKMLDSF